MRLVVIRQLDAASGVDAVVEAQLGAAGQELMAAVLVSKVIAQS